MEGFKREAQLCGTSDYPMLHYIRQKYSSYYKLGMRPGNAEALVKDILHYIGLDRWHCTAGMKQGTL